MKLSSNQEINDAIHNVVDHQRRFIKSCAKGFIDALNNVATNGNESTICFNLDFCFIVNATAQKQGATFSKLKYPYDKVDEHLVADGIIDKFKQLAKTMRNDYTPVLDQISVVVEEDGATYDYGIREYIDSSIYDDLENILESVSSKELSDMPIMMEL